MKGETWMQGRRLVAAVAMAAAALIATTQSARALNFGPGSPSAVFDGDVVFVLVDARTTPGVGPAPTTEVVGVVGNVPTTLVPGFSQTYALPSALGTSIVGKTFLAIGVPKFDQTVPVDIGGGFILDLPRSNILFTTDTANPGAALSTSAITSGMNNAYNWEATFVRPSIGASPTTDLVATISAGSPNSYTTNLNQNETNTLGGAFPFGVGVVLGSASQNVALWMAQMDLVGGSGNPTAPPQEVMHLFDFTVEDFGSGQFKISIVPEPGTALLFGAGMLGLAWTGRRKQRSA